MGEPARKIKATTHKTGTREEWLAARMELLKTEKELTRRSDELARRRQELPWVPMDKEYRFETDEGAAPRIVTADWGYLRLRRAEYDDAALQSWLAWIREQPWTDAAVFFKHENEARGPRFALRFMELIEA